MPLNRPRQILYSFFTLRCLQYIKLYTTPLRTKCHCLLTFRANKQLLLLFLGVVWRCARLVRRPLFGLMYQPRMMDYDVCGAVGEMIGRGNRSTRRKPAPLPRCLPQITHDITWVWTRAFVFENNWLTAWVMVRSQFWILLVIHRTPQTRDQPITRSPLSKRAQTQRDFKQTFILLATFKHVTLVLEIAV
jgi:hypothetical protein